MLTQPEIEAAAAAFWARARGRPTARSPVDLERAVARALPLAVCKLPEVTAARVAERLRRMGAVSWEDHDDRPLRACLFADTGHGIVFLDGTDPEDEQRFSLAHEVAHFLLHYEAPRHAAEVALGHGIVAVLDRRRPPTLAERFSAALAAVPIEPYRHAIARHGARTGRSREMEDEADSLALEILVHREDARRLGRDAEEVLVRDFGLPRGVARWAAARDAPPPTPLGVVHLFGRKSRV